MWWIIGMVCILAVTIILACCKVSGDCSREEETDELKTFLEGMIQSEKEK